MDSTKVSASEETKLHFLDYWRIIRIRKTVILAVFLLVVLTATVVTFLLPQYYSSTATIRVQSDKSDITEIQEGAMRAAGYDPYFIQTEFQVLESEQVMGRVVKEQDLLDKWTKKFKLETPLLRNDAIAMLQKRTTPSQVRNTSLIEISVIDEDPKDAADLANAIAKAYKDYRLDQRKERTYAGIESLEDYLNQKNKEVAAKQKEVDDLREKLNIPDMYAGGESALGNMLMSGETLRKLETLRIESQAAYVRQSTLMEYLLTLSPTELAQTIPTALRDQLLTSFLQDLSLAQQALVSLQNEYGPEHSEVKKVRARVEDLNGKIKLRVDGALLALKADVDSMGKHLKTLEEEVAKAQKADIEMAQKSRPYFDKKRELQELQRFQQVLAMKIYSERSDISLPKESVVEIVNNAIAPKTPIKPNKPLNISLGIIIGLVVGIGLAFFIEYLDTSVKTIDDVERALGSPVLGVIPQNVGLLIEEGAESPHAEAYRVLRTNLLFSRKDEKLNSVAVVSAGAGEGKSTTIFNLAAVFAQSGQRVIVVDSDLRRPTLHKMMKVTNNIGLTNYLLKQNTLEEVIQTSSLPTLDFMASGKLPSSSLGILSSTKMRELITELKQHYDFVFFDSPPVMGVSDASVLASEVDMTLQVIQYRRYPQPMNIRAKQLIEKVGGNLAGIVLNNINMSQDESYYYYSGYYHEYYSKNEDQEPETAAHGDNKETAKS